MPMITQQVGSGIGLENLNEEVGPDNKASMDKKMG